MQRPTKRLMCPTPLDVCPFMSVIWRLQLHNLWLQNHVKDEVCFAAYDKANYFINNNSKFVPSVYEWQPNAHIRRAKYTYNQKKYVYTVKFRVQTPRSCLLTKIMSMSMDYMLYACTLNFYKYEITLYPTFCQLLLGPLYSKQSPRSR